jgi:hypothetical protein
MIWEDAHEIMSNGKEKQDIYIYIYIYVVYKIHTSHKGIKGVFYDWRGLNQMLAFTISMVYL